MSNELFKPYRSTRDGPWGRAQAAHLLRRAGFRPDEESIREAVDAGVATTVARLTTDAAETERFAELDPLGERLALRDDIGSLAGWWLARMVHTANPLAARLSVFWHNHFATSNVKVRDPVLMLRQLRTMERYALGSFEALLLAMARDPAMIVWLDGDSNNKGRPNENFARELLELFTLGVGNYGERDIKEIARAFTGWRQRRGEFAFARADHDDGEKQVLGHSGRFDGGDVVPIVLAQPAAARLLSRKLLREFVTDVPDDDLIAGFADVLRGEKLDIRAAVRVLFASRALFAQTAHRARISSPVEFVAGTARALDMRLDMPAAARATGEMGQRLFEPPSVKGWEGGRTWVNSATMLVRMNAAAAACRPREDGVGFDAARYAGRFRLKDAAGIIAHFVSLFLDGDVPASLRSRLDEAAGGDGSNEDRIRRVVQLIVASPEYQLV